MVPKSKNRYQTKTKNKRLINTPRDLETRSLGSCFFIVKQTQIPR